MIKQGKRFWTVTVVLAPFAIVLGLIQWVALIFEGFYKWVAQATDAAGWILCWIHRKMAGNPVETFREHMRRRRWT